MNGFKINNGYLDLSKTDFNCSSCNKKYSDSDNKYLNRMNKNKKGVTSIRCECGNRFKLTYNYMSEIITF